MDKTINRRFCVAPMLDWTDRHDRYFLRLISRHALLYTEMVTTGALIHGDLERHLQFNDSEHPLALQLGGSDPQDMALCARMAEDWGYDEVNINVGCPSDRVQNGQFGACLMARPELVGEIVDAMSSAVQIPVTVKHRIGIDHQDDYADLERFVSMVASAGCRTFIVHARKAWLQGLSAKENRDVPPLDYERVFRLKKDHPDLEVILNGGLSSHEEIRGYLPQVDGVMAGREVYQNPYFLADVDALYFGVIDEVRSRDEVVEAMFDYIEAHLGQGGRLNHITRHMLGLFHGQPGAKRWRRTLSEESPHPEAGLPVVERAWSAVRRM
ncbi:MAG: tRNA dihydrouridine(20/20a) synthase DusA [Thiotrichales bacterium]